MFVSLSFWRDLVAFGGWKNSGHFTAAHDTAREAAEMFRQLRHPMRYDCPVERPEVTDTLTDWLLARVGIDYPLIHVAGATLRNALEVGAPR
jgi:hypothetical protein